MVTFRPPHGYGIPAQHVISPAQHLGYIYLAAFLVDGGSTAEYIKQACADAHAEGAPKDVVCHSEGRWKRRSEMNLGFGRRLDSYARALVKYQEEVQAERTQRST